MTSLEFDKDEPLAQVVLRTNSFEIRLFALHQLGWEGQMKEALKDRSVYTSQNCAGLSVGALVARMKDPPVH